MGANVRILINKTNKFKNYITIPYQNVTFPLL